MRCNAHIRVAPGTATYVAACHSLGANLAPSPLQAAPMRAIITIVSYAPTGTAKIL